MKGAHMATLMFRGVTIRYVDTRMAEGKAIILHRLHLTADMTPELAEEMGWRTVYDENGVPLEGCKSQNLTGAIKVVTARFSPNGLEQHEIEISANEIKDFSAARSDGSLECRFQLISTDYMGAVEAYLRVVGDAVAALYCARQEEQAVLEEQPMSGDPAAEVDLVASLASAASMGQSARPVPRDPDATEWRTAEEIAEGVPHHVLI